jgi:hypothetical protein
MALSANSPKAKTIRTAGKEALDRETECMTRLAAAAANEIWARLKKMRSIEDFP